MTQSEFSLGLAQQGEQSGIISAPPASAPAVVVGRITFGPKVMESGHKQAINGQTAAILIYLQSGNSITPIEALDLFGCFRLGARIYDLKRAGYAIKTEMVQDGKKRHAKYSL
jgi:hypothetical protein